MPRIISIIFCVVSYLIIAQPKLVLDKVYTVEKNYFTEDIFGNSYYLANNKLSKKEPNGNVYYYNNIQLGAICSIDVINPLKILLFYKDFNTVVILDKMFTEVYKINLSKYALQADYCSMASGNKLWVFDKNSGGMVLLDYINEKIFELNTPKDFLPTFVQSDYNNWYFVTENQKVYKYDLYGTITHLADLDAFDQIFIGQNQQIIFSLADNLYLYTNRDKKPVSLLTFDNQVERIWVSHNTIRLLEGNKISIYTIKKE